MGYKGRAERIFTRADELKSRLDSCSLCPRRCGVNRLLGEKGFCRTGLTVKVARAVPHMGEEPVISGVNGAGTIFFTGCHLACIYCQNHQISQGGLGRPVTTEGLALIMLELKNKGCHNIEWVSATHVLPQAVEALALAVQKGLDLPVVLNSGGYENPETIALLDGIVDIYMPDAKYALDDVGRELSGVRDYPYWNKLAVDEMVRQVGLGINSERDIARKGIIVRHLVLPGYTRNSEEVLNWLIARYGQELNLSLMSQFFPAHRAKGHALLSRGFKSEEYEAVADYAIGLGFENGWMQDPAPVEPKDYPDFNDSLIRFMT